MGSADLPIDGGLRLRVAPRRKPRLERLLSTLQRRCSSLWRVFLRTIPRLRVWRLSYRPLRRQRVPGGIDLLLNRRQPGSVFFTGNDPLRLIGVVHQRHQREVVCVREGIKLVRVTLRTGGGHPQPGGAGRAHAIDHRQVAKLQRIDAALFIDHRVAMKTGGNDVVDGRLRQHVTGNLANGEGIKGHVVIEGPNHPVSVGPDLPGAILLITVGIGVAGQVEPAAGPALAIPGARQQPIHQPLVGIG